MTRYEGCSVRTMFPFARCAALLQPLITLSNPLPVLRRSYA